MVSVWVPFKWGLLNLVEIDVMTENYPIFKLLNRNIYHLCENAISRLLSDAYSWLVSWGVVVPATN